MTNVISLRVQTPAIKKKKIKHALFFINNCLRRRELNACGEERKAVKTRKQTDTQTYLIK